MNGFKSTWSDHIESFDANFQMRAIVKLVNGALSLFSQSPIRQEFFDSYEAARAWVEQHRHEKGVGAA
jgi:hypothetical protein